MLNPGIQNAIPQTSVVAEDKNFRFEKASTRSTAGIHVDLSPLSLEKSKKAERDKDIDESELPDNVKQALKAIRDKQDELEENKKSCNN